MCFPSKIVTVFRAQTLREAHEEGKSREHVESALKTLPVVGSWCLCQCITSTPFQHPAMIRGVNKLKASTNPVATFFCLSNANEVFIGTILKV